LLTQTIFQKWTLVEWTASHRCQFTPPNFDSTAGEINVPLNQQAKVTYHSKNCSPGIFVPRLFLYRIENTFQSTHSQRVRPFNDVLFDSILYISIHALTKSATRDDNQVTRLTIISIHALTKSATVNSPYFLEETPQIIGKVAPFFIISWETNNISPLLHTFPHI
jgi:hypothetical protein